VLHMLVRFGFALTGVASLLVSFGLYDGEQHWLHARLEDWWVRFDDRCKRELRRTDAFFGALAESMTALIDRALGKRLISERAVTTLILSGIGGAVVVNLFVLQASTVGSDESAPDLIRYWASLPAFFPWLVAGFYLGVLTLYLTYERRTRWLRISARALVILLVAANIAISLVLGSLGDALSIAVNLAGAMVVGVGAIGAIRIMCRRASAEGRTGARARYLIGVGTLLTIAGSVALHDSAIGRWLTQDSELMVSIASALVLVSIFNFASILLLVGIVCVSAVLLIYRIAWPILSRLAYNLPRHRLVFQRGVLLTISLSCFAITLSSFTPGVALVHLVRKQLVVPSEPNAFPPQTSVNGRCSMAVLFGTTTTHRQAEVWFRWGRTPFLLNETPHRVFDTTAVYEDTLRGLTENTTYYFASEMKSDSGESHGRILTFSVLPCDSSAVPSPIVAGIQMQGDSMGPGNPCSAKGISGQVTTAGFRTEAWFEWGNSPQLGYSTPRQVVAHDGLVGQWLSPLRQSQTYYYRIVLQSSAGTLRSDILNFTTSRCERLAR